MIAMIDINDNVTIGKYARGDNNRVVTIGRLKLWFSYNTVIAFHFDNADKITVSENVFSRATGAHINTIEPDKSERWKRDDFEKMLVYQMTWKHLR